MRKIALLAHPARLGTAAERLWGRLHRCKLLLVIALFLLWPIGCRPSNQQAPAEPIAVPSVVAPEQLLPTIERLIAVKGYAAATQIIEQVDIAAQVEYAVAKNDLRWISVYEDTLVIPGFENESIDPYKNPQGHWNVPGTQDAFQDMEWQRAATKFAEHYNRALIERIRK